MIAEAARQYFEQPLFRLHVINNRLIGDGLGERASIGALHCAALLQLDSVSGHDRDYKYKLTSGLTVANA